MKLLVAVIAMAEALVIGVFAVAAMTGNDWGIARAVGFLVAVPLRGPHHSRTAAFVTRIPTLRCSSCDLVGSHHGPVVALGLRALAAFAADRGTGS